MEFKEREFSRMRYNVHKVEDSEDIVKKIPELGDIPEIADIPKVHKGLKRTAIVKYIAYMYDPGTPILTSVPDVMKRRFFAAELAGFPKRNSVKFTKEVEDLITKGDEVVNNAITAFVVRQNSPLYTKLTVYLVALELQLKLILSGKYKSDAIETVDQLESNISDITRRMLNDDSAKFVVDAIYDKVRSEKLELRPEDIADKIADGEKPVDVNPYGEDYEFPLNEWKGVKLLSDIPTKGK